MRAWVIDNDVVSHTRLVRGVDHPRGSKISTIQVGISSILTKLPGKTKEQRGQSQGMITHFHIAIHVLMLSWLGYSCGHGMDCASHAAGPWC